MANWLCCNGRTAARHAVTSTPQRLCHLSGPCFLLAGLLLAGLLPRLLSSNSSVSVLISEAIPILLLFPLFLPCLFPVLLPPCPIHSLSAFNTPPPSLISGELPSFLSLLILLIQNYSTAPRLPISDSPDPMFSPQETPTPKLQPLFKSKTHPPLITPPLTPSSSIASGSSGAANSGEEQDGDAPIPPSRFLMVSDRQHGVDSH